MNAKDIDNYIQRYTGRYEQYGYSPETLGWGRNGRQDVRFSVLGELAIRDGNASVLDVGCGFGDLYAFLKSRGWNGQYTGIDLVPVLVEKAKEIYPGISVFQNDIGDAAVEAADYVIASGIFNAQLDNEPNDTHIEQSLRRMFGLCNKAICVDFLSTYVDFRKDGSWHTDPAWALQRAKEMSKRVVLRHDYMPYEFALIVVREDGISPLNTFQGYRY